MDNQHPEERACFQDRQPTGDNGPWTPWLPIKDVQNEVLVVAVLQYNQHCIVCVNPCSLSYCNVALVSVASDVIVQDVLLCVMSGTDP